jgi:hypothetical protein
MSGKLIVLLLSIKMFTLRQGSIHAGILFEAKEVSKELSG